jgi:hypothetical protein
MSLAEIGLDRDDRFLARFLRQFDEDEFGYWSKHDKRRKPD